ncbi:S-adenosyl-L-methionine-dependent methyltransferase [Geopyxis carbonaria]|nr:S-adenosyl-L-methionine-dependent methyltransferase [Geopyxis carbonaria]
MSINYTNNHGESSSLWESDLPISDLDLNDNSSDDGETDSIFSADERSRCSSLSSIARSNAPRAFRFENGRRYNAFREGSYVFPNDEREQDRMAIMDQMMHLLFEGELYLSPLENPRRILDLGTGTGIWSSDMATKFPNARIIGTDLSPIQVPPPDNCIFEIEDANSDWVYPANHFSMIHARQLHSGITSWRKLCQQSYTHLHPNGWAEFHETPVTLYTDSETTPLPTLALTRASALFNEAMERTGRNTSTEIYMLKEHMRAAGFVDIVETRMALPLNSWMASPRMRQVGRYNMLNFLEGIEGFLMAACTRALEMSVEETAELVEGCKKDILDRKLKLYYYLVVVRGRKPAAGETLPQQTAPMAESGAETTGPDAVFEDF